MRLVEFIFKTVAKQLISVMLVFVDVFKSMDIGFFFHPFQPKVFSLLQMHIQQADKALGENQEAGLNLKDENTC